MARVVVYDPDMAVYLSSPVLWEDQPNGSWVLSIKRGYVFDDRAAAKRTLRMIFPRRSMSSFLFRSVK